MRFLIVVVIFSLTSLVAAEPLYLDPEAPLERRVEDLLSRMTLAEKIGQMTQLNLTVYNSSGDQADVDVVAEKFIPLVRDHHIGSFLNGAAVPPAQWARYGETLQRLNLAHSRLRIPLIYGVDHVHGSNYLVGGTVFPQPINLAATFEDSHAASMGEVTAAETADLGHHWIFAPIQDIAVNSYWPRFYETFGEEPRVAARMGSAFIRALQGSEQALPYRQAATAKHYLGYGGSDSGWDRTPAQIPDQFLHEFYLPPFRAAVEAGVKTVMVNSAEINGIPVHANSHLLTDILREELGFEGVVVTDWEDILYLVSRHKVAHDEPEATEMALKAGVDMSMTALTTTFPGVVEELVKTGRLSEDRIDASVRRILRLKFELGLFEHPFPRTDRFARIGSASNRAKAQLAADRSLVLLKNDGLLPLNGRKVAVLGDGAHSKRVLGGGWTLNWQGKEEEAYPADMLTIAEALEQEFGTLVPPGEADALIVVVAEQPYAEGEGNITDLALPRFQQAQLAAALTLEKPVVLVVVGGRPRLLTPWADKVEAILWAGLPGFEGASSVARVVSGRLNPSGKLPFNYPSSPGHLVPVYHKANEKDTSLFPFGHGLSYTDFTYSGLTLTGDRAAVTVTNSGTRAGRETVLWFLRDEVGKVTRPVRRLHDYTSVTLAPGESITVSTALELADYAYPDENGEARFEDGWYTLTVGSTEHRFYKEF